jgi:myo-inositol-1-phosphate synthase
VRLQKNDPEISPSQIYAYAALKMGVPYANGAPHLTVDAPALMQLARDRNVPIAGKDFKTGQTFMKTLIAPGLKSRMLGSRLVFHQHSGQSRWRSAGRSGLVQIQGRIQAFGARYRSCSRICIRICTRTFTTRSASNYYPPRGDAKEGWDNIDIFGWLGYPMQIKINFLCRDSILAAPLVLDMVLFMDLAQRAGMRGVQEWLSFYFKAPMTPRALSRARYFHPADEAQEHAALDEGRDLITHLGLEYYD